MTTLQQRLLVYFNNLKDDENFNVESFLSGADNKIALYKWIQDKDSPDAACTAFKRLVSNLFSNKPKRRNKGLVDMVDWEEILNNAKTRQVYLSNGSKIIQSAAEVLSNKAVKDFKAEAANDIQETVKRKPSTVHTSNEENYDLGADTSCIEEVEVSNDGDECGDDSIVDGDSIVDNVSIDIDFFSDLSKDHHPLVEDDQYVLNFFDESDEINQSSSIEKADKWLYQYYDSGESHECNVVEELHTFRSVSSKLPAKELSDLRLLSLNNIYLFSEDIATSITSYLPLEVHQKIMKDLLVDPPVILSDQCVLWCAKIRLSNWVEVQKITIPILSAALDTVGEDTSNLVIANILHRIATLFYNGGHPKSVLEDSFVHNFISCLFENTFQTEASLEIDWANGQLGGKRKIDSEKNPYKPDYVVYVSQRADRLDLTCAEAKPPNRTTSFPKSDLVKVGQEMRWMINKLVREGVEKPIVGGVLVSGFSMCTFKMDIIDEGVYRMMELSSTSLFRTLSEITLLPNIVSNLSQLKSITITTAKSANKRLLEKSKGVPPTYNPPLSWLRDTDIDLVKKQKK